jgi:hypothetical protein
MIGAGLIGQQRPAVRRNDHRCRPGGLRSLAAVAGPESTPFHGADGADALQGLGQQRRPFLAASFITAPREQARRAPQYTVTEHTSMVSEYKRPAMAAALNRLADSVSQVIWSRKR